MRDALLERIVDRMAEDPKILFVSADFGAPRLDTLRRGFAQRFVNVGIAEQNLINVSAGLALEGFVVYAYAIAPFISMRPYEQIRNNLAMLAQTRDINVNLISVGAGVSYEVSGPTHHCLEDLAIMRTLPNMAFLSASDSQISAAFVDYTIRHSGPKYVRLDAKALPCIQNQVEQEDLDQGYRELVRGQEICIVSTGYMSHKALRVAKHMNGTNHPPVGAIDLFVLEPLSEDALWTTLSRYKTIVTLEEGFVGRGGLDCLVRDLVARRGPGRRVRALGFPSRYLFEICNREALHRLCGLDHDSIIRAISDLSVSE